jgi:hypothetical protein
VNARDRWLEYSDGGGSKTFAEWCAAVIDPAPDPEIAALTLRSKVQAVLDDPELLRAVLAAVYAATSSPPTR